MDESCAVLNRSLLPTEDKNLIHEVIANNSDAQQHSADKYDDSTTVLTPPAEWDPLLMPVSSTVREGDHVLLLFGDGRHIFAHCVSSWKGYNPPLKISKRSYSTSNLIGLPYGTVLELDHARGRLIPLPDEEDILPDISEYLLTSGTTSATPPSTPAVNEAASSDEDTASDATSIQQSITNGSTESPLQTTNAGTTILKPAAALGSVLTSSSGLYSATASMLASTDGKDNRHLIDTNSAQSLTQAQLMRMKNSGQYSGSTIVQYLIENSSTFERKTDFSKVKYLTRKTKKHQPRCRLTRCTGATVSTAMYLKNPRLIMNLREDSLGQMLSYANVYAGAQVLLMESCLGILTGALAQRMAGYGKILSVYTSQQPAWADTLKKFNLTFAEHQSIKWVHSGDIFGVSKSETTTGNAATTTADTTTTRTRMVDSELRERQNLRWPCPLQDHTRKHLEKMSSTVDQADFLSKRCSRFARKLTRHTTMEANQMLTSHPSDSLILASKYDPTETLLQLLPYLAASCPFVVFYEHIEPLVECFRELQKQNLAINLRLSDTWLREYQILPGRTHPNMNMSQCGGYLLSGIKLCPLTGQNDDLQDDAVRDLRAHVGGRRGKKNKKKGVANSNNSISNINMNSNSIYTGQMGTINEGRESKRTKFS